MKLGSRNVKLDICVGLHTLIFFCYVVVGTLLCFVIIKENCTVIKSNCKIGDCIIP